MNIIKKEEIDLEEFFDFDCDGFCGYLNSWEIQLERERFDNDVFSDDVVSIEYIDNHNNKLGNFLIFKAMDEEYSTGKKVYEIGEFNNKEELTEQFLTLWFKYCEFYKSLYVAIIKEFDNNFNRFSSRIRTDLMDSKIPTSIPYTYYIEDDFLYTASSRREVYCCVHHCRGGKPFTCDIHIGGDGDALLVTLCEILIHYKCASPEIIKILKELNLIKER